MRIELTSMANDSVRTLIAFHAEQLRSISEPESCHVLDESAMKQTDIDLFAAWDDDELLGVGGLARHSDGLGEIKSMRTATSHEGKGVGTAILHALVEHAREIGLTVIKLETGSDDHFAAARRLYERFGFTQCPPFANYTEDPNSAYYELELAR